MLYVLRLSGGDCIVITAENENQAQVLAAQLMQEQGESVVSVRTLAKFGLRLSPNDDGSLDVNLWDDSSIEDILVNEYPVLNEAFHTANSVRFMPDPEPTEALLDQLRDAHDKNTEIIRRGLEQEVERFAEPVQEKRKAVR